jgi:hypothetical protein
MLKRGEPPWHWPVFASVNEAETKACPLTPVIRPNADATVAVGQFFSRCSVPFATDALTHPASAGFCAKVPGTTAAAAPASASAARTPAAVISFSHGSLLVRLPKEISGKPKIPRSADLP